MDTGGLGLVGGETPSELCGAVENQVEMAIAMANLILMVVDGRTGQLPHDLEIADRLRKTGKRIVLAVNKIDSEKMDAAVDEWASLGFADGPIAISAEHGRGIGRLESCIYGDIQSDEGADGECNRRPLSLAIVGAPNVGKSSLLNAILGENRAIVSDEAGTTRDSIYADFAFGEGDVDRAMRIVDTAGLRALKKISSPVEYFSLLRTNGAIESADVVFLAVDAAKGLTSFDKSIAANILEAKKCLAVIVNKWDLAMDAIGRDALPHYEDINIFLRNFAAAVRGGLFQWPSLPILFLSARTGYAIEKICRCAIDLEKRSGGQIGTGQLNRLIGEVCGDGMPSHGGGKPFKIFYALQTGMSPITIRLYCNDKRLLHSTQLARLRSQMVEKFCLGGCPLHFDFVSKESSAAKKYKK
jgi:GTP-binding protein